MIKSPSLSVKSNSIVLNSNIPSNFKGAVCNSLLESPNFYWEYTGFVKNHIEFFELLVEDINTAGTSENGKFRIWDVTQIHPLQVTILESAGFIGSPIIHPTDYESGDMPNGWHGPCSNGISFFRVTVSAIIKEDSSAYVFGDVIPTDRKVKGYFFFEDHSQNLRLTSGTASCGELGCPPGSMIVNGLCEITESVPVIVNPTQYTVGLGNRIPAYGQFGMRLYTNVDSYTYPLIGNSTTGILQDNNGTGISIPLNPASPVSNIVWDSQGTNTQGRLNIAGIWSTLVPNPLNEWIGFSACFEVPSTKEYCIGLAADNRMRFSLNGQKIVEFTGAPTNNFDYWHVIPITLNQGTNVLEMEGLNVGGDASFAAEIYDATPNQLLIVSSVLALEPYIIFSTRDRVGTAFDIGDNSGYMCPNGYSYNLCTGGNCTRTVFTNPMIIECCWRIQNCKDVNETYLIKISPLEVLPVYGNDVYTFVGPPLFVDKCFKVLSQEVCEFPDFDNITIGASHGTDNCAVCDPSLEFESCIDPGSFVYISLASGEIEPDIDDVCTFTASLIGCYSYKGQSSNTPVIRDLQIDTNYNTSDCNICIPCLRMRNCFSEEEILIHLSNSQDSLVLDNFYTIDFQPGCWQYLGSETCLNPIEDVTIITDHTCDQCYICIPKFRRTNCNNSSDTSVFWWDPAEDILDESKIYVFQSDTSACYRIERIYSTCDSSGTILDVTNIDSVFDSCDECNTKCYRLIDCTDVNLITYTDTDLSAYVGKIIKWMDDSWGAPREVCSTVEEYICRSEAVFTIPITTIVDCFKTCLACLPVEEEDPEFEIQYRSVKPEYKVPVCEPKHKCFSCD